jgi:hypothetical protein
MKKSLKGVRSEAGELKYCVVFLAEEVLACGLWDQYGGLKYGVLLIRDEVLPWTFWDQYSYGFLPGTNVYGSQGVFTFFTNIKEVPGSTSGSGIAFPD